MPITLYGASDDLIEVEGDIDEEFSPLNGDDDSSVIAFSDGTVVRIRYYEDGAWRISPLRHGRLGPDDQPIGWSLHQATDPDGDDYTDRLTLDADIDWLVHGLDFEQRTKAVRS